MKKISRLKKVARVWMIAGPYPSDKEHECKNCKKNTKNEYVPYEFDYDGMLSDIDKEIYVCDQCLDKYDYDIVSPKDMQEILNASDRLVEEYQKD